MTRTLYKNSAFILFTITMMMVALPAHAQARAHDLGFFEQISLGVFCTFNSRAPECNVETPATGTQAAQEITARRIAQASDTPIPQTITPYTPSSAPNIVEYVTETHPIVERVIETREVVHNDPTHIIPLAQSVVSLLERVRALELQPKTSTDTTDIWRAISLTNAGDGNTVSQTLLLSGQTLSISGGNSVTLPSSGGGGGSDSQTLSLASDTLSISNGNSVSLADYAKDTDLTSFITDGNTGWDNSYGFLTAIPDTFLRNDGDDTTSGTVTAAGFTTAGNIAVSGTVDGRDVSTDGTKLDTIETNADVTDTANVTAAGALMDSELTSLSGVKSLTIPVNTTISTFGASLTDDTTAAAARTTLGVDTAGTDNSTNVTLAGTLDYLTIVGQTITRNAIDLATDVTGILGITFGGTGSSNAAGARTNLGLAIGSDVQGYNANTTLLGQTIENGELTNPSLTITAGSGLSGGGTTALGGTATLSVTGLTTSHFTSPNISQWTNNSGYLTTVDVSSNTNLTGDTEIVLTGDALSLASTLTRDTELAAHTSDTANPHSVTKAQVGLSNVENTALSSWAGSSALTTLGTIASGLWQGTAIADGYLTKSGNWTGTLDGYEAAALLDNTDTQDLTLTGNILALTGDGTTVNLSAYLDDTVLSEAQVDAYANNNGYLTSYSETDPLFSASAAAAILAGERTNWNTGFSWGNHATAGYLTTGATQWTTSASDIYFSTGNVSIGTATASRALNVLQTASNPQFRISYDATTFADFTINALGDLVLDTTGGDVSALDENLRICAGGACPTDSSTLTGTGNIVAENKVFASGFEPASCPTGMIPVPASPQDGMQGFCIDKYEAKNVSGIATSAAADTPWVSIAQYDARAQCIRAGKHLVTEAEWLAVAHNAENVGWNWNGGVVGTNQMSNGHSDNVPASALAAAADTDPCNGTGQTCDVNTWSTQRRSYKLSNGEYIWDIGGNVWEWTDAVVSDDYPIYNSAAAGWQACATSGDGVCGNVRTTNDQWYRGGTALTRGFLRGGYWSNGANDGAFTLHLSYAPGSTGTDIGFRCSR